MTDEPYTISEMAIRISRTGRDADRQFLMRQIRHWTNHDLLRTTGEKHTGTGRGRLYPQREAFVAAYLQAFVNKGLTIGALKLFRAAFDERVEQRIPDDPVTHPTDRSLPGYVRYAEEDVDAPFRFFVDRQMLLSEAFTLSTSEGTRLFQGITIVNCMAINGMFGL